MRPRMRTVASSQFYSVLIAIVPFPRVLAFLGAEVELRAARGCPRQPRIRRDSVPATIPYSGRRSSEASGATLHQRRCQTAHVSSRPPLPRPHRASLAQRFWPDLSICVRRCSAGLSPSRRAAVSVSRSGRLQLHPLRHGPVLEVSPERDHVVDNVAQAASDFVLTLSCEGLRLRGGRANAAGLKPSSRPGLARPVEEGGGNDSAAAQAWPTAQPRGGL